MLGRVGRVRAESRECRRAGSRRMGVPAAEIGGYPANSRRR